MNSVPLTLLARAAVIADRSILSPAAVTVENGRITRVGEDPPRGAGEIRDLGSAWILPGLVNAHCHLELTSIGTLPRRPFLEWAGILIEAKNDLTHADIASGIREGAARLKRSGATTVIDHASPDTPPEAFRDLPITAIAFVEVLGLDVARARKLREAARAFAAASTVTAWPSPHAVYSIHPEVLERMGREKRHPFSVHMAESPEEAEFFSSARGEFADFFGKFGTSLPWRDTTPFKEFARRIPPEERKMTLFIHGNLLSTEDISGLADWSDSCVVHCPGSHAFFGYPAFPYDELRRRNVPIALGTDSLASNDDLDILREAELFLTNHPDLSFWEFLPMVTTNALRTVGVTDGGEIREGFRADLIALPAPSGSDPEKLFREGTRPVFVTSAHPDIRTSARFSIPPA